MKVQMYRRIFEIDKWVVRIPLSGGKAGRGHAKTSNYQVVNKLSGMMYMQFRFEVNNWNSERAAENKAILLAKYNATHNIN